MESANENRSTSHVVSKWNRLWGHTGSSRLLRCATMVEVFWKRTLRSTNAPPFSSERKSLGLFTDTCSAGKETPVLASVLHPLTEEEGVRAKLAFCSRFDCLYWTFRLRQAWNVNKAGIALRSRSTSVLMKSQRSRICTVLQKAAYRLRERRYNIRIISAVRSLCTESKTDIPCFLL